MGPEMMQQFRDQAERFGTRFITDNVTKFEPGADGEPHTVWIDDEAYKARAVILAMGAEHKKLGVPGEEELGGRGVSYCATCDAAFYKDRTTIIVGGGDSAMEEAIFLAKFSSKVTIVQPPRRVPRLEDHARARPRDREHRVPDARTPSTRSWPARAALLDRAAAAQHRDRRDARAADGGRVHRDRPRAAVGDRRRASSRPTTRATSKTEGKSTRTNLPGVFGAGDLVRPHLPPGRHGRRLRLPGRARRRVVPARQPRRPDPGGPRGHRRPGRGSSGRPPRAPSGGARRRGPRGLRRRRRSRRPTLPAGAGHDRALVAGLQGRRRDPDGAHLRRRGQDAHDRLARAAAGRGRARARRRGPGRAGRHLHPLDGLRHRRRQRRRPGARRAVPGRHKEGKNSAGKDGWTPPCPPEGDDPHHYIFTLYALDKGTGARGRRRAGRGARPSSRARSPAAPSPAPTSAR